MLRSQTMARKPPPPKPDSAPGELRLVQAFVNTRDLEAGRDELASAEALEEWIARHAAALPAPVDEKAWKDALAVREGLRALLRANNGFSLNETVVERLNRALSEARSRFSFDLDGTLHRQPAETGWPGVLNRFLHAVSQTMAEGTWTRFKACSNGKCQWAFFDASNNRMGKWCTVRRCGNRINRRTYHRLGPRAMRKAKAPALSASTGSGGVEV